MKNPLKIKRKLLKISKNDISKILNVKIYNINEWECGRRFPKSHMLINISKAYNMSNDELIAYLHYLDYLKDDDKNE